MSRQFRFLQIPAEVACDCHEKSSLQASSQSLPTVGLASNLPLTTPPPLPFPFPFPCPLCVHPSKQVYSVYLSLLRDFVFYMYYDWSVFEYLTCCLIINYFAVHRRWAFNELQELVVEFRLAFYVALQFWAQSKSILARAINTFFGISTFVAKARKVKRVSLDASSIYRVECADWFPDLLLSSLLKSGLPALPTENRILSKLCLWKLHASESAQPAFGGALINISKHSPQSTDMYWYQIQI